MTNASALPAILTVPALAKRGLARPVVTFVERKDGTTREETRWEISPEGYEDLKANQATRAAALVADPELGRAQLYAAIRGETPSANGVPR